MDYYNTVTIIHMGIITVAIIYMATMLWLFFVWPLWLVSEKILEQAQTRELPGGPMPDPSTHLSPIL